jgi:hypothetical protein
VMNPMRTQEYKAPDTVGPGSRDNGDNDRDRTALCYSLMGYAPALAVSVQYQISSARLVAAVRREWAPI